MNPQARSRFGLSAKTILAEVDFLGESEGGIYPLEVKAGISRRKKSLLVYGARYRPPAISRTTLMNFRRDGEIWNIPLYAVSRFPGIVAQAT